MARSRAFSLSGRLSRTSATPASMDTSTRSAIGEAFHQAPPVGQTVKQAELLTEPMTVRARISVVLLAVARRPSSRRPSCWRPARRAATDGERPHQPRAARRRGRRHAAAARAQATYDDVLVRRDAATHARVTAEAELVALADRDAALTAAIAEQTDVRKAAAVRLVDARREVQQIAVGEYVQSATYDDLTRAIDVGSSVAHRRRAGAGLRRAGGPGPDPGRGRRRGRRPPAPRSTTPRTSATTSGRASSWSPTERDRAAAEEAAAHRRARPYASSSWRSARATSRVTRRRLHARRPRRLLAGRRVPAVLRHRVVGARRHQPGRGAPRHLRRRPRLGPTARSAGRSSASPSTATNATRLIGDTDGGALDGDPVVDRAVGPMQFIPSTWARWSRDGERRRRRRPAEHLRRHRRGGRLPVQRPTAWHRGRRLRAGYFSYNHSEAYVERGARRSPTRYATLAIPPSPQ